ncbi:MAG TPA: metallophosphoesterase [Candidatus Thermoplasmatota archaeon]|nr:metallophosphoesterase [Candidatus Thermoplasmatota archaeon]
MRWPLLAALLTLTAPVASAGATQVHLTTLGDTYVVTFASDAANAPVVSWPGGSGPSNTTGALGLYAARIPATAAWYEVEGRRFELRAPPAVGASTRVAYVADLGTGSNASAIARAIAAQKPDLVLVGGDLAYAHGNDGTWAEWFAMMEPIASIRPLMPAFGNHEGYCGDAESFRGCASERQAFHQRFVLPRDALDYAFDWGPIHVTVLDTEAYEGDGWPTDPKEQKTFLTSSLADVGGRWNVVMYHRPLRTTNLHEEAAADDARAQLNDTLNTRADLVLQAHVHAYERSVREEGRAQFVTSGGGGRPLYDEWAPMEPWVAKRATEHHFLLLDITPTRIDAKAIRADGSTLDSFSLERPAPPSPTPPSATPTATPGGTPTGTTPPNATTPIDEARAPLPLAVALVAVGVAVAWRRRG